MNGQLRGLVLQRNSNIFKDFFAKNKSAKELAVLHNLSETRVKQIIYSYAFRIQQEVKHLRLAMEAINSLSKVRKAAAILTLRPEYDEEKDQIDDSGP